MNSERLEALLRATPIPSPVEEFRASLTRSESFSLWITENIGTSGFLGVVVAWTLLWLGWNALAPHPFRFDPFPALCLWLFIANVIQLWLMPLIMMGQNLQVKLSEMKSEAAEESRRQMTAEVSLILTHINEVKEMLKARP